MQHIEMALPCGPEHIRPARLVAASLASDVGFDVDGLEDIRIAIDELCSLFQQDDDGHIDLVFIPGDGSLEVTGHYRGSTPVTEADWLVKEILGSTTDELELPSNDSPRFRFVRNRSDHAAEDAG